MGKLRLLESGVVPVYTTDAGEQVCDGRELWQGVQSKQDFSTWVKKRLNECEAAENEDYFRFHKKMEANNATQIDYIIKLDTAKEMAMLERNEVGKRVRKYFISVEKKYKQQALDTAQLSPQMQLLTQMVNNLAAQELKAKQIEARLEQAEKDTTEVQRKVQHFQDTLVQRDPEWRPWINKMFNQAVEASGTEDYRTLRHWTYDLLEERARCDLSRRLQNYRNRLAGEGHTDTRIGKATRLDVIEQDPRLKEIYTTIIKEMVMYYIPA